MKIAIIGAMEEEVQILRNNLENAKVEGVAGCELTTGTYQKHNIVLLKSGIGKVNAAMGTTILMEKYQPDYVINTGSAGGFHHSLNVGDVIVSTEVRYHDVDVTAFGYEYGQVPGQPVSYRSDSRLVDIAFVASQVDGIQVAKGPVATGDSFIGRMDQAKFIEEKLGQVYAVEMEAAAIAQVCHQYRVPFVVLRALSDIAGKESGISFDAFLSTAAVNSSVAVMKMIREL